MRTTRPHITPRAASSPPSSSARRRSSRRPPRPLRSVAQTAPARMVQPPCATARSPTPLTTERTALAHVLLPGWYGPGNNPPLPLVISPHGRGATGLSNSKFWGNMPAIGRFAVVSPDGMGRRLEAPLVRLRRPDRRPRADARDRDARASVAPDRPPAHLRPREQHGRPGDAPAGRAPPAPARRRRRDGLGHRPRRAATPAAPSCRATRSTWSAGAAAAASASSRRCGARSAARPPTNPRAYAARSAAPPGAGDRQLRRPAADLVEQARPDRLRPEAPVEGALRRAAPPRHRGAA